MSALTVFRSLKNVHWLNTLPCESTVTILAFGLLLMQLRWALIVPARWSEAIPQEDQEEPEDEDDLGQSTRPRPAGSQADQDSAAQLTTANANDCMFEACCGQECHMKPCSITHHYLQGDGIYCSRGLPFESIYHLAYHVSSESVHVNPKSGRCASLATWYRHVETSDKSRTETFDSGCYGPHTGFIFRFADELPATSNRIQATTLRRRLIVNLAPR
jgi:hypothetical protein